MNNHVSPLHCASAQGGINRGSWRHHLTTQCSFNNSRACSLFLTLCGKRTKDTNFVVIRLRWHEILYVYGGEKRQRVLVMHVLVAIVPDEFTSVTTVLQPYVILCVTNNTHCCSVWLKRLFCCLWHLNKLNERLNVVLWQFVVAV